MWLLNALTAWDLKFQVCLGYTFTPATLKQAVYAQMSIATDICGLWPTASKAAKNGRTCTKGPPVCWTWRGTEEIPQKCKKIIIGLHHPLDGVNNPKYKLLHFIQLTNFLHRKEGTSF
jgi:hypothetical protein